MGFYSGGNGAPIWTTATSLFPSARRRRIGQRGRAVVESINGAVKGGYYAPAGGACLRQLQRGNYTGCGSGGAIYAGGGVVSIDTSGLTIKTTSLNPLCSKRRISSANNPPSLAVGGGAKIVERRRGANCCTGLSAPGATIRR